jgi:hypothetical protein
MFSELQLGLYHDSGATIAHAGWAACLNVVVTFVVLSSIFATRVEFRRCAICGWIAAIFAVTAFHVRPTSVIPLSNATIAIPADLALSA